MSLAYIKSDSVGRKIIPAPLVTINKVYNSNADGSKLGTIYNIILKGTLLPFMGSPSGSYSSLNTAFHTTGGYPPDESFAGNNEDFDSILRKQEALRWLFNEDGGSLEWQPSGGQPVVKCNPRVMSIDFEEGSWADRCNYTIQLESNWLFINGTSNIEDSLSQDLIVSSNETWSFEEIDGKEGKQFNVQHRVSAQGIIGYASALNKFESKDAWQHARDYVNIKITGTIDSNIMLAALGSTDKTSGQYIKSTNIDKNQGSYEINERWLLSNASTYTGQQFNVEFDTDTGEYNVTYQGNIIGVGPNSKSGEEINMITARSSIPSDNIAKTIATNAVGLLLGGKTLPSSPQSRTFVLDQQNGSVNFTFKWTTSDSTTATITKEVQYNFSIDAKLYTVSFSESIQGVGSTSAIKLANAKLALYTDSQAYSTAILLLSGQIPLGTTINSTVLNKGLSINEKTGEIKASWSWSSRNGHSEEVTINVQEPNATIATLQVPGRALGPIIQNMNTLTSKITTVTIKSNNNVTQPILNTSLYATGIIISDSTTWNVQTGVAERITRFLKET